MYFIKLLRLIKPKILANPVFSLQIYTGANPDNEL